MGTHEGCGRAYPTQTLDEHPYSCPCPDAITILDEVMRQEPAGKTGFGFACVNRPAGSSQQGTGRCRMRTELAAPDQKKPKGIDMASTQASETAADKPGQSTRR